MYMCVYVFGNLFKRSTKNKTEVTAKIMSWCDSIDSWIKGTIDDTIICLG